MQLAFDNKAFGNLPELSMSKFGMLKRDNTQSGQGQRRYILFITSGQEKDALEMAQHLNQQGTIVLEPLTYDQKQLLQL